jgi:hypothetical protein
MNAPYYGGYAPGNQLFAVDGDFTICEPCSLPEISYPLKGDSILSTSDIVIFYPEVPQYSLVSLGTFPNIAPWSANQVAAILEQEFVVAFSAYIPTRLNTQYNPAYALGSIYAQESWKGQFGDSVGTFSLDEFILVEEGELRDIGAGLCRFKAKWAILPPTRSEIEQYGATFPGLSTNGTVSRPQYTRNVMSRIQYDYFVFDDWDILSQSPYGYFALFTDSDYGRRLNSATGLYPNGLILPVMQYFASSNIETAYGNFIGIPTETLTDGDPSDPTSATVPQATEYLQWATGLSTNDGTPAEIVIESSTFTRWMGNIWERRTRFVQAQ